SPERDVDGDEAFEGEAEGQRPADAAGDDGDPGRSVLEAALEDGGQEAVLGERVGQPRVGEGEIAEGPEVVDDAGNNDGDGERGASEGAGRVDPGAGAESGGGDARPGDGGDGDGVG